MLEPRGKEGVGGKESPSSLGSWQEESRLRHGTRRRLVTSGTHLARGTAQCEREAMEQGMALAKMRLLLAQVCLQ